MEIKDQGSNFWEVSAWLMNEYRKEGNEERVQGIVDCRIIYGRFKDKDQELSLLTEKYNKLKEAHLELVDEVEQTAISLNNDPDKIGESKERWLVKAGLKEQVR